MVPFQQSSFPGIPCRQVMTFIPTHPPLVLRIMDRKNSRYICKMFESITMLQHKRYKRRVMIMHMNDIRLVLPFAYPIAKSYLERSETFCIIIKSIYSFAIQ